MALHSMNKIAWVYTDDAGAFWNVTATKAITDQMAEATAKVGGSAGPGAYPSWPSSWRKRRVYVSHGDKRKGVVCYDQTCVAWTTPLTELSLNEGADVATYVTSDAHLGERKRSATGSTT